MAAEDWIDVYDYCDAQFWERNNDPTQGGKDEPMGRIQTGFRPGDGDLDRIHTKQELDNNRFYVGHPRVFKDGWGHPSLEDAIEHGCDLMADGREECFIVQIVRVLRREQQPVKIERVGPRTYDAPTNGRRKKRTRTKRG